MSRDSVPISCGLPTNSRMSKGKTWSQLELSEQVGEFRIYRFTPESGDNPSVNTLCIQDTSSLDFNGQDIKGLGPLQSRTPPKRKMIVENMTIPIARDCVGKVLSERQTE